MTRRQWRAATSVVAVLLVAVMAFGVSTAWAHGEAEIRVKPDTVVIGGAITIEGEGFGQNATVSIVLEGADFKIELGAVETYGEDGKFAVAFRLHDSVIAGRYTVRAAAKDKKAEGGLTVISAGAKGPSNMGEQMLDLVPYRPWEQRAIFAGIALVLAGIAYVILRGRSKEASPHQVR